MSSKHSGARAGKVLTVQLLTLIARGSCATEEELCKIFIHDPYFRRRWYELKRQKYVTQKHNQYHLTKRGTKHLSGENIRQLRIPPVLHWDGKWRLVLFDIPINRKKHRDALRLRLRKLGLVWYQDSVWVYPYPVYNTVSKISTFYSLPNYVSFAVAERLSGEKYLRKRFEL